MVVKKSGILGIQRVQSDTVSRAGALTWEYDQKI